MMLAFILTKRILKKKKCFFGLPGWSGIKLIVGLNFCSNYPLYL